MDHLIRRFRRTCVVLTHLLLVVVANEAAFLLRFDGAVPEWARGGQWEMLPLLLAIRGALFIPFGVYQSLWRYAGIWDVRSIIASVGLSSIVFFAVTRYVIGLAAYPRSVFIIDALLLVCLCSGLRLVTRLWRGRDRLVTRLWRGRDRIGLAPAAVGDKRVLDKRVLIFGAGQAGELIMRDIKSNRSYGYRPVGFVDDDQSKVGQTIHGVRVLGTRNELPRIMAEHMPHEVMVAMPSADSATVRGVLRSLEPFKVQITALPNLRDIMDGVVTVSQVHRLSIEDLLPRAPVGLDEAPLRDLLAGRRVLVTGAGGSIGTELCMQVASLRPDVLVLYERSENSLYSVTNQLSDRGFAAGVHSILGDITDVVRLESTFAQFRPEIVFHAAAHKHVPLMESNPCEAVKNNVTGTRLVAEASVKYCVGKFVLVSSDKAVNPSSVMGATKRVAELVLKTHPHDRSTAFITVRFGNVLGSNGSVIPRFLEQIKSGGPVTVTHPEIRRFFMLLPEAVHLVLHAAGLGRDGGIYVLDMGEQIKVVDMARDLIRLSGLVPDEEIKLTFVGLRPGEKLFEELIGSREAVQPCSIPKVFQVTSLDPHQPAWFRAELRRVERAARMGDSTEVIRGLHRVLPEFVGRAWDSVPELAGKMRAGAINFRLASREPLVPSSGFAATADKTRNT